jgi:tRNA A-37 threonylcarbamoyl transferase component Bud32
LARLTLTALPYTPQCFQCGRVRGFGHPQLVTFLQSLPALGPLPDDANLTVYREHPNLVCEVCLPPELGLPWACMVVKRFGWRGSQHYLASPFKRSRALKAYRTACHLLTYGLHTPLPLGVCEERRWGFVQYNVYATAAVADVVTLQQYCALLPDGPSGLEEVMRLVAAYTRRMHDSGLWHRDLVSSNLLLTGPPGHRQVYLVDLNRARRLPYVPAVLRAMDLARLGWREWLPQFCALYSAGRFSATRLLWMMHLYGRWRTWRWHMRRVLKPLRARLRL